MDDKCISSRFIVLEGVSLEWNGGSRAGASVCPFWWIRIIQRGGSEVEEEINKRAVGIATAKLNAKIDDVAARTSW